uniref:hypothetical protein n=1 Tax=Streptococcus pluranimalium TaxID=82348 RepID=UPI003F69147A
MPLNNLSHFTEFNASKFFLDKKLRFVSAIPWLEKTDSGSEVQKGVKVGVLIFDDNSDYPNKKTNIGEKLIVKVPFASVGDYDDFQPMKTVCEIVDVEKASVYGEYRNQLSLTAKVVQSDEIVEL